MKLTDVVARATAALTEARKVRTRKLFVKCLEETITLQTITMDRWFELTETKPERKLLHYIVYEACRDLQQLAVKLAEQKTIKEYIEVMDIFSQDDIVAMFHIVKELSNFSKEREIEEIKNS